MQERSERARDASKRRESRDARAERKSNREPLLSSSLFRKHGVLLQHFNVQHQHSTDHERKGVLLTLLAQLKNQRSKQQRAPSLFLPVQETRRPTSALQCATPTLNGSREKRSAAHAPRSAQKPTQQTTESPFSLPPCSANTASHFSRSMCNSNTQRIQREKERCSRSSLSSKTNAGTTESPLSLPLCSANTASPLFLKNKADQHVLLF